MKAIESKKSSDKASKKTHITVVDIEGVKAIKLSKDFASHLRSWGAELYAAKAGNFVDELLKNMSAIQQFADSEDDDEPSEFAAEAKKLVKVVYEISKPIKFSHDDDFDVSLTFSDVSVSFSSGLEVEVHADSAGIQGGIVSSCSVKHGFFGTFIEIAYQHATNNTSEGFVNLKESKIRIPYFIGKKSIKEFAIRPVRNSTKLMLDTRGKKFMSIVSKPTLMHFNGHVLRKSWFGDMTFESSGRAMIDVRAFKRMDNDYLNDSRDYGDHDDGNDYNISEDKYWLCPPFVYGFSFKSKIWGEFNISGLSEIKWNEGAFNTLVLDPDRKHVLKELVSNPSSGFNDIISGKGGGSTFLLHGAPGTGKTLTAEAVSELLHRPLYMVSSGELGTEPERLENNLRNIFELARIWNAVVLIDEADVYLEQRNSRDLLRNAMVGVFLRLLEYHQGVVFLTTNRVGNFDEAVFSRVSLSFQYPKFTMETREIVWRNLLDAANIRGIDCARLAVHDLNGRQIKNILNMALTLSKSNGQHALTTTDFQKLIPMVLSRPEAPKPWVGNDSK